MAQELLLDRARRGSGGMEPEAVRVWLPDGFMVSVGSLTFEESVWRRRKAKTLIKLLALARGHRSGENAGPVA
ncbi:MAG TPA: hypothetical protein VFQ09_05300, partial [Rubrobacter sp.]|nr:hypothetical protein [Rubrobacter sp.]